MPRFHYFAVLFALGCAGSEGATDSDNVTDPETTVHTDTVSTDTGTPPEPSLPVVISEVMPYSLQTYIELYNDGPDTLDLNGCLVENSSGQSFEIAQTTELAGQATVLLASGIYEPIFPTEIVPESLVAPWFVWPAQSLELHPADDSLTLSCGGIEVDRMRYIAFDPAPPTGCRSVSLDPLALGVIENDDQANWCESPLWEGTTWWNFSCMGSPGEQNPSCSLNP